MSNGHVLATTTDVFERLKSETAQDHKDIEGAIPLMSPELDRKLYIQVLERYYGFYQPLEPQLAPHLKDRPGLQYAKHRTKLAALERDLTDLGVDKTELQKLPVCTELPKVKDLPSALGVLYVLEGSTLGGQIIYRNIEKKLKINIDNGASFLAGYGMQTGAMWKRFKEIASPCLLDTPKQDIAIAAARETFAALNRWMAKRP